MTLAASNFIKGLKTLLGGKQCEQLSGFARQRPRPRSARVQAVNAEEENDHDY